MNDRRVMTGQELTERELDEVVGGLNPQPLPPRWAFSAVILPNTAARFNAARLNSPL